MKIAVTATGQDMDAEVDPRFGRCAYFLIIETEDGSFEAVENPNSGVGSGAGIQSAQLLAERGVQALLTGNCGPNAYQTLSAAGIDVTVGCSGPVKDAVEQFRSGGTSSTEAPNVPGHFGASGNAGAGMGGGGMGGGMGLGMGRGGGGGRGRGGGGGRGMGRGGGRGMGRAGAGAGPGPGFAPVGPPSAEPNSQQELNMLQQQAAALSEQLQQIQERIKQLEEGP